MHERDFDHVRATSSVTRSKPFSWQGVVVPLLIFGVVFFVASRSLLRSSQIVENTNAEEKVESVDASSQSEPVRETGSETASRNRNRAETGSQSETKPGDISSAQSSALPLQPMKTVTVLIDPSTGLIAKTECPTKTRMTYPAGNEPQASCTALHPSKTQAQADATDSNESKLKSFSKRVATPGKWIAGKD
jgi:hypothetical protein